MTTKSQPSGFLRYTRTGLYRCTYIQLKATIQKLPNVHTEDDDEEKDAYIDQ